MTVYMVMKYTRDGSMGTVDEHSYDIIKAFSSKEKAITFLKAIVNEYNEEHKDENKVYNLDEYGYGEDVSYSRILYAGSPLDDDIDYKQLYIDILEVE